MSLLELQDVNAYYGNIHALMGVSLTVEKGEIVALIGANGAGKSSTLQALSGLVRPAGGSIRFAGEDITRQRPDRIVRAGLVQVPEGRAILNPLTVAENLELGAWTRADRQAIGAARALISWPWSRWRRWRRPACPGRHPGTSRPGRSPS